MHFEAKHMKIVAVTKTTCFLLDEKPFIDKKSKD